MLRIKRIAWIIAILSFLAPFRLRGQSGENVLLVVNRQSEASQEIAAYYARARKVPAQNVCRISVTVDEMIPRDIYAAQIEKPIANCLTSRKLQESVLYIVTTLGEPLRISGSSDAVHTTGAAVDSELAELYTRVGGTAVDLAGPARNPVFNQIRAFGHPGAPLYMVTRLAAYDVSGVKAMIDRSLAAADRGKVVIDLRADENTPGNTWLRGAAARVPRDRLVLDDSASVIYDQRDVIAYASWGFNDPDRHRRKLGFHWLPGAIMTDFVSTNARTFHRPADNWTLGSWKDPRTWFAGSPQDLCADEIEEGVTGIAGHVDEPYLALNPRPDILIPAYLSGRNLAESFYASLPALSWQNVVIGDPLCRLKKP